MSYKSNYHDEKNKQNIIKLRAILDTLPEFCKQYFIGMDSIISSLSKIAYAYDLKVFFEYLHNSNPVCAREAIIDYKLSLLDDIKRSDIEEYMQYLSLYTNNDSHEIMNNERGKRRKLASLKSFYNYYYKNELISTNPAALVPMPKLHDKEIIRMSPDEVAILLDQVEAGSKLTKHQSIFHSKTKIRDVAIISLLLGTGIRVSECVGLNIYDVDFNNLGIKIRRKGGYEDVVYFGDEVESALIDYINIRKSMITYDGHEDALFLSIQNKRLGVRSVENLVKKYTSLVTGLKTITPHKLRSTYGTTLYQETGDIYLVADVLGHKDVNTTRKHYAAMKDYNKRKAAKVIKLREP